MRNISKKQGDNTYKVGQRIVIRDSEIRRLVELITKLVDKTGPLLVRDAPSQPSICRRLSEYILLFWILHNDFFLLPTPPFSVRRERVCQIIFRLFVIIPIPPEGRPNLVMNPQKGKDDTVTGKS